MTSRYQSYRGCTVCANPHKSADGDGWIADCRITLSGDEEDKEIRPDEYLGDEMYGNLHDAIEASLFAGRQYIDYHL